MHAAAGECAGRERRGLGLRALPGSGVTRLVRGEARPARRSKKGAQARERGALLTGSTSRREVTAARQSPSFRRHSWGSRDTGGRVRPGGPRRESLRARASCSATARGRGARSWLGASAPPTGAPGMRARAWSIASSSPAAAVAAVAWLSTRNPRPHACERRLGMRRQQRPRARARARSDLGVEPVKLAAQRSPAPRARGSGSVRRLLDRRHLRLEHESDLRRAPRCTKKRAGARARRGGRAPLAVARQPPRTTVPRRRSARQHSPGANGLCASPRASASLSSESRVNPPASPFAVPSFSTLPIASTRASTARSRVAPSTSSAADRTSASEPRSSAATAERVARKWSAARLRGRRGTPRSEARSRAHALGGEQLGEDGAHAASASLSSTEGTEGEPRARCFARTRESNAFTYPEAAFASVSVVPARAARQPALARTFRRQASSAPPQARKASPRGASP